MADAKLNALLREGGDGVRKALREVHTRGDSTQWLTLYLLQAIEAGTLPSITFTRYLDVCRDPHAVRAGLEQSDNAFVRAAAIHHFVKLLRSETAFRPTWNEVGGAPGLVALMQQFSVAHVKLLCHGLGSTGNVPGARADRQRALSELLHLLCGPEPGVSSTDEETARDRDPRPLRKTYLHLAKSCTADVCMKWQDEAIRAGTHRDYRQFYGFHTDAYQAQMLHDHFQPSVSGAAPVILSTVLPTMEPLLEVDKRFWLTILEKVVEGGPERFLATPKDILERLAFPVLQYLQARKGTDAIKERVWSLIFTGYTKWPMLATQTTPPQWHALLRRAISRWKRASTTETQRRSREILQSLLELPREIQNLDIERFVFDFLGRTKVNPPRRYELFCLFLRHYRQYNIDIESMTESDKQKLQVVQDKYPCNLFTLLPPASALRLLETLVELKPGDHFVRTINLAESSILALPCSPDAHYVDMDVLHCFLRQQTYGSLQDIEDTVNNRKTKAIESRDWKGRAFWTKSAMFLSIASGSLQLYSEMLVWARRFHRDPMTVAALYGAGVLGTEEGLRLLAGVPISRRLHLRSLNEVEQDIAAGNRIISQLLEAVVDGLAEAGISITTWGYITSGSLAWDMCARRLKAVDAFQAHHGLSDDDIFKLVWEPTIQIAEDISDHAWRFFNELAKARDELWTRVRLARNRAVAVLSSPWPKGLPTHLLSRLDSANLTKTSKLPYVVSRAKEVVFADPTLVLGPQPEDKKTQVAIGGFCENYVLCLMIYLSASQDQDARISRSQSAWDYATNELRGERMSQQEAGTYWRQWVKEWVVVENGQAGLTGHPEEDASTGGAKFKPRYLDATCLDSMLVNSPTSAPIGQLFKTTKWPQLTRIDLPKKERLWSTNLTNLKTSDHSKIEARITTAVQVINAEYGSDSDVESMMKPFPGGEDARSPAPHPKVSKMKLEDAFQVLERFHSSVPVHIIQQLARSAINRAVSQEIVVRLLQLLAKSNRPWDACPLLSDIMLDGQRYSSWHRHLFNTGFLNILPAEKATKFVQDIGNAIAAKLESPNTPVPPPPSDPVSPQQHVKITTVKMLAEVIRTTITIDSHTGTAILLRIFLTAKHIDIRAAVIQGLLKAFDAAEDDQLRTSIFVSLQRHAIHVASSINERHPMSESDWVKAEAEAKLPEIPQNITHPKGEETRPISKLLLEHLDSVFIHHPQWMQRWSTEIIENILLQSIEHNTRWIKLFLKINNLSIPDDELPFLPVNPSHFNLILEKCSQFLTLPTFNLIKRSVMFKISPPVSITNLNDSIRTNKTIITNSNAKSHWETCSSKTWNLPPPLLTAGRLLESPPPFLLSQQHEHPPSNHLTIPILQAFLVGVSEVLIMQYPRTRDTMNKFINDLLFRVVVSRTDVGSGTYNGWLVNILPVIQGIVQRIENITADEGWKTDCNRVPVTVPDVFEMKVKMLARHGGLFGEGGKPASREEMEGYCVDLYKMIEGLAEGAVNRGVPYHDEWKVLKGWVVPGLGVYDLQRPRGLIFPAEFLRVAVGLWGVEDREGEGGGVQRKLVRGLVVELVCGLICGAEDPENSEVKGEVLCRVQEILDGWAGGLDWRVRDVGLKTGSVWDDKVLRRGDGVPVALRYEFGLFD